MWLLIALAHGGPLDACDASAVDSMIFLACESEKMVLGYQTMPPTKDPIVTFRSWVFGLGRALEVTLERPEKDLKVAGAHLTGVWSIQVNGAPARLAVGMQGRNSDVVAVQCLDLKHDAGDQRCVDKLEHLLAHGPPKATVEMPALGGTMDPMKFLDPALFDHADCTMKRAFHEHQLQCPDGRVAVSGLRVEKEPPIDWWMARVFEVEPEKDRHRCVVGRMGLGCWVAKDEEGTFHYATGYSVDDGWVLVGCAVGGPVSKEVCDRFIVEAPVDQVEGSTSE